MSGNYSPILLSVTFTRGGCDVRKFRGCWLMIAEMLLALAKHLKVPDGLLLRRTGTCFQTHHVHTSILR